MLKLSGQQVGILRRAQHGKAGDDLIAIDKLSDATLAAIHADLDWLSPEG